MADGFIDETMGADEIRARFKFLRSEQTELAHARQSFLVYALSHPEVGMRLLADEREIYRLHGGTTLDERIADLFGKDRLDAMEKVEHEDFGVRITGYVSLPQATRADRSEQFIFVNGRPASAPVLHHRNLRALPSSIPPLFPLSYAHGCHDPHSSTS